MVEILVSLSTRVSYKGGVVIIGYRTRVGIGYFIGSSVISSISSGESGCSYLFDNAKLVVGWMPDYETTSCRQPTIVELFFVKEE